MSGTSRIVVNDSIVSSTYPLPTAQTDSGYRNRFSFARKADTVLYAANDVIGTDTSAIHEFTNIGPSGGNIYITDVALEVDTTAVISGMTSYTLHLYDASPTAILDNAAWDLGASDRTKYIGSIALGTPVDIGSTLYVQTSNINKMVKLATGSTSLYGEIVTVGTWTPTSGLVFVVDLHTKRVN